MLTTSELIAGASEVLLRNGYTPVATEAEDAVSEWRSFEDPYGVVGVAVFETWSDLVLEWPNRQAKLVELISEHIVKGDAKTWDGYLVLLTPSTTPDEEAEEADTIRYNTSRVRKLLATAPELDSVNDVERILLPLLPLPDEQVEPVGTPAIERVADLLTESVGDRDAVEALLRAFRADEGLVESLHELRNPE
jgi:hypothetical protein